jgi:hypothetical protein
MLAAAMLYAINVEGIKLFVLAATIYDVVVAQCCHPKTFADHVGLRLEIVF